jgi:hypothetical protein
MEVAMHPVEFTLQSEDTRELVELIEATEKAGINSLRKLKYFILFANNEGKSMAELAGRAKTKDYNEIQQAVIELSVGRYHAATAPQLIRLGDQKTTRPGTGRRKPIRLTPKGRRLFRKIDSYCTGRH